MRRNATRTMRKGSRFGAAAVAVFGAACGTSEPPDTHGAGETKGKEASASTEASTSGGSGSTALVDGTATTSRPAGESDSSGQDTSTGSPGDCPFEPNPILAAIPDNTALDLGSYECEDRMPQIALGCDGIFDFSRINYDPGSHRIIAFGGGHSASGRTDLDTFDLDALTWASLYPSMSCEEVEEGDTDPRGFHLSTGHPAARHSYDQNVIGEVDGVLSLLMFSSEGFSGFCHPENVKMNSVARRSLEDDAAPWEYRPEFKGGRPPWHYAGSAEFDPVSAMVILMGASAGAGPHYLWVYDPSTGDVVHSQSIEVVGIHSQLHYDPAGDRMIILFEDGESISSKEIRLNRADWTKSTVQDLVTGGVAPGSARASAYDTRNRILGTFGAPGVFSALDLATDTWSSQAVELQTDDPGVALEMATAFALDYDPINNVFLFIAGQGGSERTWAYRYLGPAAQCER